MSVIRPVSRATRVLRVFGGVSQPHFVVMPLVLAPKKIQLDMYV